MQLSYVGSSMWYFGTEPTFLNINVIVSVFMIMYNLVSCTYLGDNKFCGVLYSLSGVDVVSG